MPCVLAGGCGGYGPPPASRIVITIESGFRQTIVPVGASAGHLRRPSGAFLERVLPTLCEFFALMAVLIVDDTTINGQIRRYPRRGTRGTGPTRDGWWSVTTAIAMTRPGEHTQKIIELLREGRSDTRIAKRLGISRDEVRAAIRGFIEAAHLDDHGRLASLAEQVGIARHDDD